MEGVILAAVLLSIKVILCESFTGGVGGAGRAGMFVGDRLREMPLGEGKRVKDEHVLPEDKFEAKKQSLCWSDKE